ncbi:hypothetical protein [Nocardiopsis alborubida]|uniref:Uncharacterized protein n=1 Tax=Nocardiopsis alborubida TaxID=146802 RepID=A0A7X6MLF9_9ACTN|nr:hypothetical protein [Nocardiopsis alborubida]NKZ01656.1 hypothetical protein [Nocardiopsis alborubida]
MDIPLRLFTAALPALLSGALVLAMAGCADGASGAEPSPSSSPPSSPEGGEGNSGSEETAAFVRPEDPYAGMDAGLSERLHLPVYDYRLDEYEGYVVRRAEDTLTVECLVDLGYEAEVNSAMEMDPLTMRAFGPHNEYRRYGNTRADIAEEHGFSLPLDDVADPYLLGGDADLREQARSAVLSTGEGLSTPSGDTVPEGGCVGRARQRIDPDGAPAHGTDGNGDGPDTPDSHLLVEELLGESYLVAVEGPAVAEATVAWEACMAGAVDGFHGTPLSGEGSDPEAAVPALECADSSGYLDAFVAAERAALEGLVAEHEEALTARRDQLRENLETSLDILGW